jgi:acylphosphatase
MDKWHPTGENSQGMTVCKKVRYSGRVQGVGFRYTTQRVAEGFPVAGYVRNLPDGDVELVAEGPAEQVEAFLASVASQLAGYIERTTVHDEAVGSYRGFRIRH